MRNERLACSPVQSFYDTGLKNFHHVRPFGCGTPTPQDSLSEFCRAAQISFGARQSAKHQSHTVRRAHRFALLSRRGFLAELLRLVLRTRRCAGLIAAVTGCRSPAWRGVSVPTPLSPVPGRKASGTCRRRRCKADRMSRRLFLR